MVAGAPTSAIPPNREPELSAYERFWNDLRGQNYVHTTDVALGLSSQSRSHIARQYFTDAVLKADIPEVHQNRVRARDVLRYRWTGPELHLEENDRIEIANRGGYSGERLHARVWLLSDPTVRSWAKTVLTLIPPELRQRCATFSVNLFRTRDVVVNAAHQDLEEFVLIYVVAKHGSGATTRLHLVGDPTAVVYDATLEPGDILLFRDAQFLHSVTPLRGEGDTFRDAVVCTFDYPETYLPTDEAAQSRG